MTSTVLYRIDIFSLHFPMVLPVDLNRPECTDISIPSTPVKAGRLVAASIEDGATPGGASTARTRSIRVGRPSSAPPRLAQTYRQTPTPRPSSPLRATAGTSIRPKSAPSRPHPYYLHTVREIGVDRSAEAELYAAGGAVHVTGFTEASDCPRCCSCVEIGPIHHIQTQR